jgi:DnaJ-class molecular chaperone
MFQVNLVISRYREIALAYHPALQHPNPNLAYQIFAQAAEAFDVLYDRNPNIISAEKKYIYDQFG